MSYLESLSSALPVILLVGLGTLLRRFHFFGEGAVDGMKKLVVNISLPLVLFNAFASMAFEARFLWIVASIFLSCVLVMFVSQRLGARFHFPSRFFPFLMAGFEAGMMGYAIFGSIFGPENTPVFAIMDLGQVLFVFLVMIPTMENTDGQRADLRKTILFFISTPVVMGIFLGILFNLTGLYAVLIDFPLSMAVIRTSAMIGTITTPLVALVLGYDLKLNPATILRPLQTVAVRMLVWVIFGFLFNHFVLGQLLGLGGLYQAAAWMLFVLPPAFVVPLFMTRSEEADRAYIADTLSLSTLAALAAVVVVRALIVL